jgi:RimJ/RimL family protein N-acetyltransferase
VPSIVVCIAENQRAGCEKLAADGVIVYVGKSADVDAAELAAALRRCLQNPALLAEMSQRGRALVDGRGAARLSELLAPTARENLTLRPARASDVDDYFFWVNEPEVRRQSLNSEPIAYAQHVEWFGRRVSSEHSRMFVLEAAALPVGQIRFDIEDEEAVIDYSIDPAFRGRGWASALVSLGIAALTQPVTLRADVKSSNRASCAVFERLRFRKEPAAADAPMRVFRHRHEPSGSC